MQKTRRKLLVSFLAISAFFVQSLYGAKIIHPTPGKNDIPAYSYSAFNCAKYGLSKKVFDYAMNGFLKLEAKGLIRNKKYITICDMSVSSKQKRLYIIDLQKQKVIYHLRVAHGQGSGEEYATRFSNTNNSHQTSLGFYTTGSTYIGENGISLQLKGHENGFNNNAAERAVVMHGSQYVEEAYFKTNKKIGRSWGCPAIAAKFIQPVTQLIKNGSCLFIYHPNNTYAKQSKYLN